MVTIWKAEEMQVERNAVIQRNVSDKHCITIRSSTAWYNKMEISSQQIHIHTSLRVKHTEVSGSKSSSSAQPVSKKWLSVGIEWSIDIVCHPFNTSSPFMRRHDPIGTTRGYRSNGRWNSVPIRVPSWQSVKGQSSSSSASLLKIVVPVSNVPMYAVTWPCT